MKGIISSIIKPVAYTALSIVAAAALTPMLSLAASFGSQNFFYAQGNVITPLPGFTLSLSVVNGGTGTTTGGVTNGVEYFDGTKITNSTGFTYSPTGTCATGNQWIWTASSTLSNSLTQTTCPVGGTPLFTYTTTGRLGIGSSSPTGLIDVDQGNNSTPSVKATLTAAANTNLLFFQQINAGGDGAASHALMYVDNRGSNPFLCSASAPMRHQG